MLRSPHFERAGWRSILAGCCFLLVHATSGASHAQPTLTWYGHSAFSLSSPTGTVVLMDPYADGLGYDMPELRADAVTISHEHFDHNAVEKATGTPLVLRGLSANKRRWRSLDTQVGDVRIRAIPSHHDEQNGKERGQNTIFVFETGGIRIVHLGDLGHPLSQATIQRIGPPDVLLIPVGGSLSLGAREASRVIASMNTRMRVLPMHYKSKGLKMTLPLAPVDPFLKRHPGQVRRHKTNRLSLSSERPKGRSEIIVLGYR